MSFFCGHFHIKNWNNFFCNTFCRASDCSNQVKLWVLHWLLHSKRNKPSLTKENGEHLWSSARVSSRTASVFNSYLYNTAILTWSSWFFICIWLKNKLIDLGLLYTHAEIMEPFFLQKLCKTYTTEFDVYKMYLKFKQTFVHVLYTKLRGLWQLNLLYKIYINVCQNVGYILHIFCVHQGRSKKVYIIRTTYTICVHKFIQNAGPLRRFSTRVSKYIQKYC